MRRYEELFSELNLKQQGAFVPFVTIGDPNISTSYEIIEALLKGGADALELGLPFSDPLADGPTIQSANLRAIQSGVKIDDCFELIKKIRTNYPKIPIGLLVYANLVFNMGISSFYSKSKDVGVDSILVADLPIKESTPFKQAALSYDIAQVFICPPNANESLIKEVALNSSGYVYLLSRAGVTGAEIKAELPIENILNSLSSYSSAPALQGFGISEPSQVAKAISVGARGAICGSAIVKIIESNLNNKQLMLDNLEAFVSKMKAATKISK